MNRPTPNAGADSGTDTVFELRRYTLKPGQRETLIALFDAAFVETQEAVGMSVVGQFRDPAQPDHFVWFRGFVDQAARTAALPRFYGSPVWAEHGPAANATMLDSDNVLMLKPAGAEPAFATRPERPVGAFSDRGHLIVVATHHFPTDLAEERLRREAVLIADAARAAGATVLASLISDHSPNGFPRLPVRAGENVVVTVARPPQGEGTAVSAMLARPDAFSAASPVEIAELQPTSRSRLR